MDITTLVLDDHHRQRQMFARLDDLDRKDHDRLRAVWAELAGFLEVHAAAEEAVLYPEVLRLSDPKAAETKDAISDHNDIRDALSRATASEVGSAAWWHAVGAARSANTEHMGEEEDDVLPHFRGKASLELRGELGLAFEAAKTPQYAAALDTADKDPDGYVEEHS